MAADDPLKERFEILRRRARQAATTATQQEQEGLKRRFAQLGQVGSGAQIRTEAQASERGAKRLQRAEETIGLAELGERQRLSELAQAREFARGEREAGQRFAAQQGGLGRAFARQQAEAQRQFLTGERQAGQTFAGGQAEAQRAFISGERAAGQTFAREEREDAQSFAGAQAAESRKFSALQNELSRGIQNAALDMQELAFSEGIRRFDLEFLRDSGTIDFNKAMAQAALDQNLLDQLGLPELLSGQLLVPK